MVEKKPQYHLKIIMCGAGAVGKTALVRRYVENKFDHNYLLTIGMDPSNKVIDIKDESGESHKVSLLIYDVAGQERFQTLREVFFRGAHGAFLVFDLTRDRTVDALIDWHRQIMERVGPIPIFLIGNKADLTNDIEVDKETVMQKLMPRFGAKKYFETSALKNEGVMEAFHDIGLEAIKYALKM